MKHLLVITLLLLAVVPLPAGEQTAAAKRTIAIQPFTGFNSELAKLVATNLETEYAIAVTILPAKPLPKSAYYKPRSRYRADTLLDHLEDTTAPKFTKIIGLTHRDISCTNGEHHDWGIFGLGSLGGRPCVVSTFRLRARGADEKLFRQRLVRVATHEIGHTLGLHHCPDAQCNMVDAEGSILSVDNGTGSLCQKCRREIAE